MAAASEPIPEMPFAKLLGLEITKQDKDHVTAKMLVRPELCTSGGAVHGGVLMAFADSVGAIATFINLPEGAIFASVRPSAACMRTCCSARVNAHRGG